MSNKIVVNCQTGAVQEVELTLEEIAERELQAAQAQAERELEEAVQAEQQALKDSANAKLLALGLSPEEVAAITGA